MSGAAAHPSDKGLKMLPISAKDRIEIRPYNYAVELARRAADKQVADATKALEEADKKSSKAAAEALERAKEKAAQMVADAEEEAAKHPDQRTYQLKVPTTRTRAAVNRDVMSEGIPTRSNLDIVNALASAAEAGELTGKDAELVRDTKTIFDVEGKIAPDIWDRVWEVAKQVPETARMIADRAYRWEIERFHLVRHHVVLDGYRTPLPEMIADAIPETDRALLATKVIELLNPSEEVAKN